MAQNSPAADVNFLFSPLLVSASRVNLISLTAFPVDVSLAGSSAGTKRMWQRRRRETQSSLLCFITPFSVCLEGFLRENWPRPKAHGDIPKCSAAFIQKQHPTPSWPPTSPVSPFSNHLTHRRPAAHAPHRVSDKVAHQSSVPMGPPSRILRIPIIPWCVSWLFLTWSTCCLIGMWPHSTPISWVPAFDFHCGLTGLLIMQHNVVRWAGSNHCKLSPCQLTTPPRRACTPQIKKQGFQL